MMAGIKGKDTRPEMVVRRMLHHAGFRYRVHSNKLPGRPDLVLPRYKVAIFVNGCFWHGHENCHLFRLPKSRTEFWATKIEMNRSRDVLKSEQLLARDWRVLTIWECALKGKVRLDADALLVKAEDFIKASSIPQSEIFGSSLN